MNLEPMQKAAVLIEALPYIQRFNRKIVEIGRASCRERV